MALTEIKTSGIADDAVTTDKLANAINTERTANTAKVSTTINNNADNRIITGSGTANTLEGEANLTFNGDQLAVTGTTTVVGKFNGATIPTIEIFQTTNNTDLQLRANSTGGLVRTASNTPLVFGTNQNERMRIDANGKVGIGTASPVSILHLHETGSDGSPIIQFSNGDTGVTTGDGFAIGVADNESPFIYNRENTDLRIATNNTERMRILAGGGLTFNGDTAAANALDDYEEGTFTPLLGGSNYGSYNITGTGKYTKVGRIVHFQLQFSNGDLDNNASGDMRIRGWPYSWSTTSARPVVPVVMCHNVVLPDKGNTDPSTYCLYGDSNGIEMYGIISHDGTDWDGWSITNWESSGLYLDINGSYMT